MIWATAFICMAALAKQQWARPVRHDVCAPQCGGVCHEAASADGDAAHEQAAAALLAWERMGYHGSGPASALQNEPDCADVSHAEDSDEYSEPSVDVQHALEVIRAIHGAGNKRKQPVGQAWWPPPNRYSPILTKMAAELIF